MISTPAPLHHRRLPSRFRLLEITAFVVLAAAVVVLALDKANSSQSSLRGSGTAATQTRDVAPFSKVELAGGGNVNVSIGAEQRVVVKTDDNLLDRFTTRVVSGRLVVGTRGSFSTEAPTSIDVTVPRLQALALTGGGLVTAAGLREQALALTLSGGGLLRATGTVAQLHVLLSGGGSAELGDLVARDAAVSLTGAGRIVVNATNRLDATVTGAGAIIYTGNPKHVTTNDTGPGVITKR